LTPKVGAIPTPCRILIVDDHTDAAESLARLIELVGHQALAVTDGSLVLGLIERFRPHLLLLDIAMPGMDGWTLGRAIRERHPPDELKMVAVTAFASPDAHVTSRKAGFDAHMVKPLDVRMLEKILEQCFADPMRLPRSPI
jgi:CheY-like chemotaxis protein